MCLDRYEPVPACALALLTFLAAGWPGLAVGFCWSTVLVYHGTFCINSLAHVHGRRRYVTGDDSRNKWLLAILTMGEGWHNNHHAYQSSARQGFRRWEVDLTFYLLKLLSWFGVAWDLKSPPRSVLRNERRLGSRVVERVVAQLAESFNVERIAADAPHFPTREAVRARAAAMFARTPSLDEIVDRAHRDLLGTPAASAKSHPSLGEVLQK